MENVIRNYEEWRDLKVAMANGFAALRTADVVPMEEYEIEDILECLTVLNEYMKNDVPDDAF